MKAGIIFTGTGPILVLTSYDSFDDPKFVEKLARKGIMKFVAHELEVDMVAKRYGQQYKIIMNDVKQEEDLRVLDYNGHNVFYNFSFSEMGPAIRHE
ncbi:hypothetical protein [Dethiosulfatarculus sandiegensis]|uniref:Cytosolic protein n=1 Tax=Dethiosulfatarculus sandiegensis TaxID=1429043 RepID=A0A0D2JGJ9_9BACT|nr:hypothetical protein [Dethiosulfatarculus sandiegensis]KIX14866.1 hypothetical protein X474_06890 [Dethiosulfatarculus sandiegensis]